MGWVEVREGWGVWGEVGAAGEGEGWEVGREED